MRLNFASEFQNFRESLFCNVRVRIIVQQENVVVFQVHLVDLVAQSPQLSVIDLAVVVMLSDSKSEWQNP